MTLAVHVDVGDTVRAPWRAGIQRVVCQLVDHLGGIDPDLTLVPVVWSPLLGGFRRLSAAEQSSLHGDHPQPTPTPAPPEGRTARSVAVGLLRRTGTLAAAKRVAVAAQLATTHRWERPLALGELPPGSVLLELDTVWNQPTPIRAELYSDLRRRGVRLASVVYDLIPVEHPEWFEESLVSVFETTLRAQVVHSELILSISDHTARSLTSWAQRCSIELPEVQVFPLGSDVVTARLGDLPAELGDTPYILSVGTIEPRKNHAVLLDAFDRLARRRDDVSLVLVGRGGWNTAELVQRVEHHPLLGDRLHWLRSVGDAELAALYANASVVAVPSITEGFGLPVIEALRHGAPVLCSTGGALPEAGGDLVEYVSPESTEGWAAGLERYFAEPSHRTTQLDRIASFEPPSWNASSRSVATALFSQFG